MRTTAPGSIAGPRVLPAGLRVSRVQADHETGQKIHRQAEEVVFFLFLCSLSLAVISVVNILLGVLLVSLTLVVVVLFFYRREKMSPFDAWNACLDVSQDAADAFVHNIVLEKFLQAIVDAHPGDRDMLRLLLSLYSLTIIEGNVHSPSVG